MWENSAEFSGNRFGAPVKVTRPGIITEPLEGVEDLGFAGLSKRPDGRETAEPSIIVRNDSRGLGLLKHHLGNEDGVGILGAAPREIAGVAGIPAKKRTAKDPDVF